MIALYDLAQEMGKPDFVAALELAAEQQTYGVEYVRAILSEDDRRASDTKIAAQGKACRALGGLSQEQQHVERSLAGLRTICRQSGVCAPGLDAAWRRVMA